MGADTNALAERLEMAEQKRIDLVDLYTGGDIGRDEFGVLRAKYDVEIDRLKSMMENIKKKRLC